MKKWYSYKFQSGPRTGAEFKQFARDLRKELNKQLKSLGIKIAKYRVNHFYVSGFVEKNGKYAYFNIGDVRYNPNWYADVLIRTAESTTDFKGGMNNRTSLESFGKNVRKLLD